MISKTGKNYPGPFNLQPLFQKGVEKWFKKSGLRNLAQEIWLEKNGSSNLDFFFQFEKSS